MESYHSTIKDDDFEHISRDALKQMVEFPLYSADAILSVDKNETIQFANQAAEKIFGYKSEELLNQALTILLPPAHKGGQPENGEGPQPTSVTARITALKRLSSGIRKDGRMVPLEISILKHNRKGPFQFSVIVRDISEQVSQKISIDAHDRRFSAILEAQDNATALLTPSGCITRLNKKARAAHISAKHTIGINFWNAPWWDDTGRQDILQDLIEGLELGQPRAFVMSGKTAEGLTRKFDLSLKPVSANGETFDSIIAEWTPTRKSGTNHKVAQKDHTGENHARIDLLQRTAHIGNWEWMITADDYYWSDETYRIFCYEKNDFSLPPTLPMMLARIHPEDRQKFQQALSDTVTSGEDFSVFYRLALPDHSEKLLHHRGTLLTGQDGHPFQIVATVQDITESSKREKQLTDAMEQLKEFSVIKSQFLANLSHELRTPLNIIIGFSEFIQNSERITPEKLDEYTRYILNSGQHLLSLVNDIILALRLDARMVPLHESHVRLEDSLQAAVAPHQEILIRKRIALSLSVAPDLTIDGDWHLLTRAFAAVVSNAVKFAPEKGRVNISAADADTHVRVIIEDDGTSLPDHKFQTLLTNFGQLDADLNRQYEGIGLGLSIVRSVILLHKGSISITRSPLGGAQVQMTLPKIPSRRPQKKEPLT